VFIELVLRLARHRERAGERDLDRTIGIAAQERDIAHLDRAQPADRADDARHHDGAARPAAHFRGIVEINPRERRRKPVRIAFAADLAIGDNVDAGTFHVADRQNRRIVLRLFEPGLGHPPQLLSTHPHRRQVDQLVAVDQPLRLRIAADDGGRDQSFCH
jgi:hypothetical protein